ncbi:GAF domain-containing protein [Chryseolinea sp. T2]|uniref:GAF domain-containing protein n=1 Tax=Chryseolinea sp. T2 TaxID=3129255 RepID=UPI0030773717
MKNRTLTLTVVFAALGVFITILSIYVHRGLLTSQKHGLPLIATAKNARSEVAQTSLQLHKYLTGDTNVGVEQQVQGPLEAVKAQLQAAQDNKLAAGEVSHFLDDETLQLIRQGIADLEKLAASNQASIDQLVKTPKPVADSTGVVPPAPKIALAESPYTDFNNAMLKLETHVTDMVESDSSFYSGMGWLVGFLLIAIIAGAVFRLWRLQIDTKRMKIEQDTRLEQTGKAVASLSSFIEAISAGDYTAEVALEENSALGESLHKMRNKLRENADDDRKRNWSTSGLAQIGEILRVNNASKTELYDSIIKFVVKYTKSNQGGLFIFNNDSETDQFLELVACYAFERKKYLNKRIVVGEGLVGQCYLEGERIYLLEVPTEYVTITSGLGGSLPSALLLVPLKVNDKIFGVLELASFNKYEEHEIELVEKLTESIASTISAVNVSESTRILLEKTQQQAEEMRAQEEEMRQNMEELEATQEEMRRKEKHIQNMLDSEKKRNEISLKNRQLIMELTKNKDIQDGRWHETLEKITSAITRQLGVSRASIWQYFGAEKKLHCAKLYSQVKGSFESGQELSARMYPGYFEALTSEETIIAKEALTHPATRELAMEYYRGTGIQSVLQVPYFNEGKIAGVINCEQQHDQKDWTEEDVEFLKACADLITVAYNTHRINEMLEQLSDDQETMQTIIDNIPRAVFWKDKDLRFQGCNRIFANVAGLKSPKDLIGKTDYEMPWKEHGDAYRDDDLAVMNSRKARLDLEERNVNSDGIESWVLTSKVPVLNKHAEVVAVLGMFEDITERKRKEALMESSLVELEELRRLVQKRAS